MPEDMGNTEALSHDVCAFCALLARIMRRCLAEQDTQFIALISQPSMDVSCSLITQANEVLNDQAA